MTNQCSSCLSSPKPRPWGTTYDIRLASYNECHWSTARCPAPSRPGGAPMTSSAASAAFAGASGDSNRWGQPVNQQETSSIRRCGGMGERAISGMRECMGGCHGVASEQRRPTSVFFSYVSTVSYIAGCFLIVRSLSTKSFSFFPPIVPLSS